jgi:hypothetical protein
MKKPVSSAIAALATVAVSLTCGCKKDSAASAPSSATTMEDIGKVPYLASIAVPAAEAARQGVTLHDGAKTAPGYQLFVDQASGAAQLMTLDGEIVREWKNEAMPFKQALLAPNGDLLAIGGPGLVRMHTDGTVAWTLKGAFHNDIAVFRQAFLTLRSEMRTVKDKSGALTVRDDIVTRVSGDGKIVEEFSLFDALKDKIPQGAWERLRKAQAHPGEELAAAQDLIHANSVGVVHYDWGKRAKAGDLMVSMREIDTIATFSASTHELKWSWGAGVLDGQHHPEQLQNGRLLVFDNGAHRGTSRVIELARDSEKIMFEFTGAPEHKLYSKYRGAAQSLPNGNIQITEADAGRVIEIAPSGEVVWEYFAPIVDGQRHLMERMERIQPAALESMGLLPRAVAETDTEAEAKTKKAVD